MAIERVQVLKFGGTSVGGPDSFQQSSHVVEMHRDNSAGALVVVSAMAGVTDLLMQAYNFAVAQDPSQALKIIDEIHGRHRLVLDQIAGKRSSQEAITKVDSVALTIRDVLTAVASLGDHYPKLRDKVVSAGEMMSPWLLATQLEAMDVPVKVFDAGEIMVTDGRFGDANPDLEATIERVAASPQSAGKRYDDAVKDRWYMDSSIPSRVAEMKVIGVEDDMHAITNRARVVFCALGIKEKDRIRAIEDAYAVGGVAVISNNSAHRPTPDVPMMIPEVNPQHAEVIRHQREKRGLSTGFIAVKPNCSIQSFVPILDALDYFGLKKVSVVTSQALSGAGKTLVTWPEMGDNVNPFIGGEEEKTEREPLKIWGDLVDGEIVPAGTPTISATCTRVPVSDGHLAAVSVLFERKPGRVEIMDAFESYNRTRLPQELKLPSAPDQFIVYQGEDDRPQTKLDRDKGNGMSIVVGRLREDTIFHWKFIGLSHNTVRGAAGGAILTAELLKAKGYL